MLRHYQQRCVEKTIAHLRQTTSPALIEAATGAGKSHIIAHIAHEIHSVSGKRVLCLAPSGELVEQNQDALEYSSEEESEDLASAMSGLANSNIKQKEKVFKIDHNKINYFPFRKNFYVEVPDIARMTQEEVDEYRQVCI